MRVVLQKIEHQWVLPDEDFRWLQQHIGEALEVFSLAFDDNKLLFITIHAYDDSHDRHAITLFQDNGVKLKLIGTEDLACIDTI